MMACEVESQILKFLLYKKGSLIRDSLYFII